MTYYEYLLEKKENGELRTLLVLGLPTQLVFHMEICDYHLHHLECSQFQVALEMNTSKRMVQRAYLLLNQCIK